MYRPYQLTGVLATDIFVYLCHLNTAKHFHIFEWELIQFITSLEMFKLIGLFDRQPIPEQMLENILKLEEAIGDAETADSYLQSEVLTKTLEFHKLYSGKVKEKMENGWA